MHLFRIGAAALNLTPKDWAGNVRNILGAMEEARARGCGFLCLPELCLTGYGCEDEFHVPYVQARSLRILMDEIVPATRGLAVGIGLPVMHAGCVYNAIAHVADSRLIGFVAKQNLAGDGVHYETRFFKAWPRGRASEVWVDGKAYPIGDLIFDHEGLRVGYEVCEDAWVARRPGVALALNNVDLILNPSASHFAFGKFGVRERFVREGSRAFHCAYVYANLLGNESGRTIYDGDCLISNSGMIAARSVRFHYGQRTLVDAVVDLDVGRVQRQRQASFQPEIEHPLPLISVGWQPAAETEAAATPPQAEALPPSREWEFAEAIALGLYDYLRKSRSSGFTLSLSGGADSAACLTLVHHMAGRLLDTRPDNLPAHLQEALAKTDGADQEERRRHLTGLLCNCAYQATTNSGDATKAAARTIAEAAGARFVHVDVQPLVEHYERIAAEFLGRSLSWELDDLTKQNIQARCRAPGIWAIANATNSLLLATSNRSEAAVGYCTMDGDTAGSISPIGGIDKAFLLNWLEWAREHILPALTAVTALAPTAELRPAAASQTDETDLMPYSVLNRIQKLAVVRKAGPRDIFNILRIEHPEADDATRFRWLSRYLTLWSRNQWKRERYAPAFHVDDENLDPRSWCRFPILSGGYEAELAELAGELGLG